MLTPALLGRIGTRYFASGEKVNEAFCTFPAELYFFRTVKGTFSILNCIHACVVWKDGRGEEGSFIESRLSEIGKLFL